MANFNLDLDLESFILSESDSNSAIESITASPVRIMDENMDQREFIDEDNIGENKDEPYKPIVEDISCENL